MSTYTQDQKDLAISRYVAVGCNEAAREVSIPAATVSRWANAAGVGTYQTKDDQTHNEARMAQVKENLSHIALQATEAVLEAIEEHGAAVKCRDAVGAWTRAIHDYQLLTGGATERVGQDVVTQAEQILDEWDARDARKETEA